MARPKLAIRPVEKTISIPESLVAQVELELYSPLEGKVPHGAWSRYIKSLLQRDLENKPEEGESAISIKP
jgi:hypothetical protein